MPKRQWSNVFDDEANMSEEPSKDEEFRKRVLHILVAALEDALEYDDDGDTQVVSDDEETLPYESPVEESVMESSTIAKGKTSPRSGQSKAEIGSTPSLQKQPPSTEPCGPIEFSVRRR